MTQRKKNTNTHSLSNFKYKYVKPKTSNQEILIETIRNNDVILVNGPAGSGKTYCSIGEAIGSLSNQEIDEIVVAKPLIEAEKPIGAMPGDMNDKILWFFNSLTESFLQFIDKGQFEYLLNNDYIRFLPIGFWRGHTFSRSAVMVDECQNLTMTQLKLIFTRIGPESKLILCGDTKQSDIKDSPNPFETCIFKLKGINKLNSVVLNKEDIVRHSIISEILDKLA